MTTEGGEKIVRDYRESINTAAIVVISISFLLALSPAVSASMVKMSVEDLTKEADVILVGDVKDVGTKWGLDREKIYTYSTVSVNRYIKGGTGEETLTIISEGGRIGSLYVWVEDTPTFLKDEKILVFLKKAGKEFNVVGLAQGKYTLTNGVLIGREGEKILLKDFLRQIETAMPPDAVTPAKTPETPGFDAVAGFLVLFTARRMLRASIN